MDADPQGSITKAWLEEREKRSPHLNEPKFTIIQMAYEKMAHDVIRMALDYDFVIIDGPPGAEKINRSVIIASDMVIVICEPSGFSSSASKETLRQLEEAQITKPHQKSAFLVSRRIGNTILGRDIRAMLAEHDVTIEIPILKNDIPSLIAYAEATTNGQTIFEYAPKSEEAYRTTKVIQEMEKYYGQEELQARPRKKAARA